MGLEKKDEIETHQSQTTDEIKRVLKCVQIVQLNLVFNSKKLNFEVSNLLLIF